MKPRWQIYFNNARFVTYASSPKIVVSLINVLIIGKIRSVNISVNLIIVAASDFPSVYLFLNYGLIEVKI